MESESFGKIQGVTIGYLKGGSPFGVHFDLGGSGWGVGDFVNWSNAELRLKHLFGEAKVVCVADLIGKPIAVMFDGNIKKSWRILTEVL